MIGIIASAQNFTGDWTGTLSVQGTKARIVFHIQKDGEKYSSTFDSPDQNAMGLPVDETTISGNEISMDAKSFGIQYKGKAGQNQDTIKGEWSQRGMSFPLVLARQAPEVKAVTRDPNETEYILSTSTGDIKGTLMYPPGQSSVPVVLIIAGSGPTDRNGNSPPALKNNSNCYRLLAQELLKHNIASLRYDKRGVGGSILSGLKESELRFDNYLSDAAGWIKMLAGDNRFSKIIVAGHSEGSLIGMIVCSQEKVNGFISIAGAGRPADEIIREQMKNIPEDQKKEENKLLDMLKKGDTTSNVPESMSQLFRPSVQPYLISWFKYDPAKEIGKLRIPVLIIQGEMDIQVIVKDAEVLAKADPNAEIRLIRKMNHVLKDTDTMDKKEHVRLVYTNPDLPLDSEFTSAVIRFIMQLK